MLEIGSECISCGTNLKKIKSELSNCGLISTDEDDTTLKIIFQNSFTHDETNKYYGNYCKAPEPEFECNPKNKEEYESLQKAHDVLEHEYECTWFLTPEAMMNLLHLRESENNRIASENAKTISTRALWISGGSLLIALVLGFSPLLYDKLYKTNELKNLEQIQESVSKTLPTLKTTQDSLCRQLNLIHISLNKTKHQMDSLSSVSSSEQRKEIEAQNKILKYIESLRKKNENE